MRTSTTRLPAALREQIDKEGSQDPQRLKTEVVAAARKQSRKKERQQLKQRRAAFFISHPKSPHLRLNRKRLADGHQEDEPAKKKARFEQLTTSQQPHRKLKDTRPTAHGSRKPTSSKENGLRGTSAPSLWHEDREEDARITWLETKLGISKGNGTTEKNNFFGDGLDDLMDDIDRIIPMNTPSSDKYHELKDHKDSEVSEFEGFSNVELNEENDGEESSLLNPQISENNRTSDFGPDDQKSTLPAESRYIPPHLRQRPTDDSESLSKLSRQIKGLLNRLSEQNIASILASIEELYRTHRRNDVTLSLTTLIVDGISSHSSHLDSFVVLHASLVTSLYRIIGVDFGAHFIQFLITSYENHYQALGTNDARDSTDNEPRGKECLNLSVLLSELYNFQVISCVLVYDVIRGLLDTLNEFDVELLLKIVRNSGQQLRQDDPSALKDIIQIVHTKMSTKQKETISSRTQFMIETLTNLKNNKVKRVLGQDSHSESVERMKKFLSGLVKKLHVLAHEPLRVSLDDLHSSEKKGKWWLVGSAWGGDPLRDQTLMEYTQSTFKDHPVQGTDSLLVLARKQGMNTDIRRGIFAVLMSSDDYVEACERLSQLNLTEVQQREIVRVILHCLGNEKQYNPYYTLVVQQLCRTSHSHKVTLQFCLWDFLRDLGEKGVGGAEIVKVLREDDGPISNKISTTRRLNVSRAYAWWIAKDCCSLTILKPVDFTVLQPQTHDFFRNLFTQLFVSSQVSSPAISLNAEADGYLGGPRIREPLEEIFVKATRVPALTQGLLYFLTRTLRGSNRTDSEVVSQTLKWGADVARSTLRRGMDVVASLT